MVVVRKKNDVFFARRLVSKRYMRINNGSAAADWERVRGKSGQRFGGKTQDLFCKNIDGRGTVVMTKNGGGDWACGSCKAVVAVRKKNLYFFVERLTGRAKK